MPRRKVEFFVVDALIYIEKVKRYSDGIETEDELIKDDQAFESIIRSLEILGESVKNILQDENISKYSKDSWRIIVGFRNILAHDYFGIDLCEVLKIILYDIFEFEKEFLDFLDVIKNKCDLSKAFVFVKTDLRRMGWEESLDYLIDVERTLNR